MDAAAELGKNPVSKLQIQREYVLDEKADTGWDCRTRLTTPNSQARTGTGKTSYYPLSISPRAGMATSSGWSLRLLYVMTIRTL